MSGMGCCCEDEVAVVAGSLDDEDEECLEFVTAARGGFFCPDETAADLLRPLGEAGG